MCKIHRRKNEFHSDLSGIHRYNSFKAKLSTNLDKLKGKLDTKIS